MYTVEDINKAKKYLSDKGYGTGSNFTLNAVANLMAEWAAKNCSIPAVVGRSEQLKAISDLKDFAYEVCPLHREDELEYIVGRL